MKSDREREPPLIKVVRHFCGPMVAGEKGLQIEILSIEINPGENKSGLMI